MHIPLKFTRIDIFMLAWNPLWSQFVQIFKKRMIEEYWLPVVGELPSCIWESCDGAIQVW